MTEEAGHALARDEQDLTVAAIMRNGIREFSTQFSSPDMLRSDIGRDEKAFAPRHAIYRSGGSYNESTLRIGGQTDLWSQVIEQPAQSGTSGARIGISRS